MGIVHSLIWGILGGGALSFLYAPAAIHIPFIFLNLLVWILFAALAGIGVMASVKACKVRNPGVAALLGGIVGLCTLYIQWAVYCAFLFGFSFDLFFTFLTHPALLVDAMTSIAEHGTWSIGRFTSAHSQNVSGIFLWIVWLVEAAGIILFPVFISKNIASALFSESQNRWLDKDAQTTEREAYKGSAQDLKAQLLNKNFSSLMELTPSATSGAKTKIKICSSGSPNENYLSVSFSKPAPTKKKPDNMDEEEIIENMILGDVEYKKVKDALGM